MMSALLRKTTVRALLPLLSAVAVGCSDAPLPLLGTTTGAKAAPLRAEAAVRAVGPADLEGEACRAEARAIELEPGLPGAPLFEANRIEILGRARGEPMVFVREPQRTPEDRLDPRLVASRQAFDRGRPGGRVIDVVRQHRREPKAMRALLLSEGYAYMSDPHDALALITAVSLPDLFEEPSIWLERGNEARILRRETTKRREVTYRYVDGPQEGRAADLLFGDRVGLEGEAFGEPLHRDLRSLSDEIGFDRARITHRTAAALVAELRFGSTWVKTVLRAKNAELSLGCFAESKETRAGVRSWIEADAPRRRALGRARDIVTDEVTAGLRFDRPEGEPTADRDGQLRPVWATAYFQGRSSFQFEEASFPVFDTQGKPWPPQVCVDFILDTFERASGTWYRARGEAPQRTQGALDFNAIGIENRRAVLAFADFAEKQPEHFQVRRFQGSERIPFGERSKFFAFFQSHDGEVQAGDVVAIHGLKRDDRVHQHAILVEVGSSRVDLQACKLEYSIVSPK